MDVECVCVVQQMVFGTCTLGRLTAPRVRIIRRVERKPTRWRSFTANTHKRLLAYIQHPFQCTPCPWLGSIITRCTRAHADDEEKVSLYSRATISPGCRRACQRLRSWLTSDVCAHCVRPESMLRKVGPHKKRRDAHINRLLDPAQKAHVCQTRFASSCPSNIIPIRKLTYTQSQTTYSQSPYKREAAHTDAVFWRNDARAHRKKSRVKRSHLKDMQRGVVRLVRTQRLGSHILVMSNRLNFMNLFNAIK